VTKETRGGLVHEIEKSRHKMSAICQTDSL